MLQVCDILCPDKTKDFEKVSLYQKTITSTIEVINKQFVLQLESKISEFKFCFLEFDASTDINDTAQLLIFIRGIDNNLR